MVEKLDCYKYGEKDEKLKVPYYASAAPARDGNLPQIMAACLYSQQYILKRYYKYKKLWNKQFSERLLKHIL